MRSYKKLNLEVVISASGQHKKYPFTIVSILSNLSSLVSHVVSEFVFLSPPQLLTHFQSPMHSVIFPEKGKKRENNNTCPHPGLPGAFLLLGL